MSDQFQSLSRFAREHGRCPEGDDEKWGQSQRSTGSNDMPPSHARRELGKGATLLNSFSSLWFSMRTAWRQKSLSSRRRLAGAAAGLAVVFLAVGAVFTNLPVFGGTGTAVAKPTRSVVFDLVPQADEVAAVNAARSSCRRLNVEKLESLEDSEQKEQVMAAHSRLEEVIASANEMPETALVFEGVPSDVVKGCKEKTLPLYKILTSATSIQVVKKADVSGDDELVHLPTAVRKADLKEVYAAVEELDTSLTTLPIAERLSVLSPKMIDPATLTDEELQSALKLDESDEQFQKELDLRAAANLPDLSQMENGRLDASLLCPIPWNPYYKVLCAALPNLERLNDAYKAEFGYDTPIISGYRSFEEQQMVHQVSPNMTTLPGTSHHSWGVAVDFDWDVFSSYEAVEVKWMVENGPKFGWRNPTHESFGTAKPEPWHYEFGTKYNNDPDWGFRGPIPEVLYEVKFPKGWQTATLLQPAG